MQFILPHHPTQNDQINDHIETPTKKNKKQQAAQLNTADSIALTDKKSSSLNQIDPHQLFQRFDQLIKISQVEEEDHNDVEYTVYRKLDYSQNNKKSIKLDFSPQNSSMTKKNKILNGKCNQSQVKGKQLFNVIQVVSPKKNKHLLQSQINFVQINEKMAFTPPKKVKQNMQIGMTAKKQSPFRDLSKRN